MNETHPLVSVALCTYNGAKFLREQLESIVHQTYQKIELVVVDDGSTDSTKDILKEYAEKFPFVRLYYNSTNLGLVRNFEKALSLCAGELIALSDQDDIWNPEKLERQVNAIGDNMLLYHDSVFINQQGEDLNKKMSDLLNFYKGNRPEVFLFFNCVSGHSILLKKQLLKYAIPFHPRANHDHWLAFVATSVGSIDYLPLCLVQYRQHDNSATDILKRKGGVIGIKRTPPNVKFEIEKRWLDCCISYKNHSRHPLIERIYNLYNRRLHSFISIPYAVEIFRNRKYFLYIQKKGYLSKLNFAFKQVWGLKAKNLTYRKPMDVKGKSGE